MTGLLDCVTLINNAALLELSEDALAFDQIEAHQASKFDVWQHSPLHQIRYAAQADLKMLPDVTFPFPDSTRRGACQCPVAIMNTFPFEFLESAFALFEIEAD
jgi:hypothetical protein